MGTSPFSLKSLFKKGYYAVVIHIFFDIHQNFKEMDVQNALHYLCYVAFTCNGTSNIAECWRSMMSSKHEMLQSFNNDYGGNLYQFLCFLSKNHVSRDSKFPGTCSEARHSPCSHNSNFDWDCRVSQVLFVIKKHFFQRNGVESNIQNINVACRSFLDEMSASPDFPCVGSFLANQFLQIAALVGLCPLACSSYAAATEPKLGSGQFIRLALKDDDISNEKCLYEFEQLFHDVENVWDDGKVSRAIIENTLCELSRSYWKSVWRNVKQKRGVRVKMKVLRGWPTNKLPAVDIVMNDETRLESDATDVFYKFNHSKQIQHFFKLKFTGNSATKVKPILILVRITENGSNNECIKVTSWKKDSSDPKLAKWESRGRNMKMSTKLIMSHRLKALFPICNDS